MQSWVIPFIIFLIIDAIVMVLMFIDERKKNKFNHDEPNIEIKKDDEEETDTGVEVKEETVED